MIYMVPVNRNLQLMDGYYCLEPRYESHTQAAFSVKLLLMWVQKNKHTNTNFQISSENWYMPIQLCRKAIGENLI